MGLIKRREPPFQTVEEAIAVGNQHKPYEYLLKEGHMDVYDFHHKYKPREFEFKVKEYVDSMLNAYMWRSVIMFPLYLWLCSLIWLFDYKEVNYQIYLFLKSLYLPMQDPYGWNLSFIFVFLINIFIFIYMLKAYDFSVIRKATKIKYSAKYFACIIGLLIMSFISFIIGFITLPVKSNACTRGSLCFLESDSMFLRSAVVLYGSWFGGLFMLLIVYGMRINPVFSIVKSK